MGAVVVSPARSTIDNANQLGLVSGGCQFCLGS